MKLITRDTDYAIRALSCIAGGAHKTVSVTDMAERLQMPRAFLRKILQTLSKKGFLESAKGRGGGFTLVVKPEKITVFDLVEIFQGPFHLNEHIFKGKGCPYVKICELKKKTDEIERNVIKELKTITVRSLVRKDS